MKQIKLTQGKAALVDDQDFDWLNQWKWAAQRTATGNFYAVRFERETQSRISMHRSIANPSAGLEVDHKDHNGLNNTRQNLRICTRSQNMMNRIFGRKNTTGFRGVRWDGKWKKYRAEIQRKIIGVFDDPIDAAKAWDAKAKELYGEFAILNFPNQ